MAAPIGNSNAKRGAKWRDALDRALSAKDVGQAEGSTLFKIASQVIDRALEGDAKAIEEIANRLDGKAAQSMTVSGNEDAPLVVNSLIRLVRPD